MRLVESKRRILDSLNEMDKSQADRVLEYIQDLLMSPKDQREYQHFKSSAMKQINQALRED